MMQTNDIVLAAIICVGICISAVSFAMAVNAKTFGERLAIVLCVLFGAPVVLAGVAILLQEVLEWTETII